jgi:nucleoside-diphosphate-sugar epimerase
MPEDAPDILDSGKVQFVIGDITQPQFGLKLTDLEELRFEVTAVIHSAASIAIFQDLSTAVRNHCLSIQSLIQLLESFHRLEIFLFVSSMSVNTFLPAGIVSERVYHVVEDEISAEKHVTSILASGQSSYPDAFPVPYAEAKYLAERLVLESKASFPVLIVRPSSIGPAIQHPYPFYGPVDSIPGHSFLHLLLGRPNYRTYNEIKRFSQDMIMDEIPVDMAANVCLLHMASRTCGIIHAGCQLHVSHTTSELAAMCKEHTPKEMLKQIAKMNFDRDGALAKQAGETFEHSHRNWVFDCRRSMHLKKTEGAIGLSVPGHDANHFLKARVEKQARLIAQRINEQYLGTC